MRIILTLAILLFSLPAFAQKDPLRQHLVSPKHVMKAQKQLNLTDAQKKKLKEVIKAAQHDTIDLQFELSNESEKLLEIVKKSKVDLKQAEAQAKRVMAVEQKVKLSQLRLAIETKNLLTKAQQKKIADFRKKRVEERKKNRDNDD